MPLTPGAHIGPYEVTGALGAGGMGEVYRARDTKLGRDVALKILPDAFAADPDRLARFKREAQLLAALNHPNIAAIYGFEDAGATHALVLELVDGPTLADELARGLAPDEALAIANQIADALQAAHERGIVHRDLKPANVKLRPDGTVKVLDFGLAKAFGPDASENTRPEGRAYDTMLANSPTLTSPIGMTGVGVILGTAAYMAPEQARGKAVDKRADIWSFGCLLYEMLFGRRAFEDEDVSLTLSRILQKDPDWDALPPGVPAPVVQVIRLCLKKDPRQRVHDIADVRLALAGAFQAPIDAIAARLPDAPRPLWRRALIPVSAAAVGAVLALGLAAVFGTSFFGSASPPAANGLMRFDYTLPAAMQFRNTGRTVLAVSPDGRRIAVNVQGGLYVRSLDEAEGRLLTGTDGVGLTGLSNPVFSPDGAHLAYQQNGQLRRLAVSGGAPIVLATMTNPFGMTWSGDTILFGQPDGIYRIRDAGGTPEKVIATADGEQVYGPQLLPDGEWVLFSSTHSSGSASDSRWNTADIVAQSIRTHERKVVLPGGGADVRFVPPGYLVYATTGGLFAVKFNVSQLTVLGAPVSMMQGLRRAEGAAVTGSANYEVTTPGVLVYVAGKDESGTKEPLVWVDRHGGLQPIATVPASTFSTPRLSSDGARLLVVAQGNVSVYDLATGREQRVVSQGTAVGYADWTTDERRVAFTAPAPKGGKDTTWTQPLDGSAKAVPLEVPGGDLHVDSWSRDDTTLIVHQHPSGPGAIRMLLFPEPATRGSSFRELLAVSAGLVTVSDAVFSPDGRFYAYLSNETGHYEVYIRPYPGPGSATTVSAGGGTEPVWGRNGELFYRGADYSLLAVTVTTMPAVRVSPPTRLFAGTPGIAGASPRARYSVTPDGKRFVMSSGLAPAAQGATPLRPETIRVVLNWTEELKRRLP